MRTFASAAAATKAGMQAPLITSSSRGRLVGYPSDRCRSRTVEQRFLQKWVRLTQVPTMKFAGEGGRQL